jgi:hypothetical protein
MRTYRVFAPPLVELVPDPRRGPWWTFGNVTGVDPRPDDTFVVVRARWEDGGANPGRAPPALVLDGGLVEGACAQCPDGFRCVCAQAPLPPLSDGTFSLTGNAVGLQFQDGGLDAGSAGFTQTRYRWLRRLGGAIVRSPAIDPAGRLLIPLQTGPASGALVALSPTGDELWSLDAGGALQSVGVSRLSDGGVIGYASMNVDGGASLLAFTPFGAVVARRDFPGVRTVHELVFVQEGTGFPPVARFVGAGGSLLQWNIEVDDTRTPVAIVQDDPEAPGPAEVDLRSNLLFAEGRVQYLGQSQMAPALFKVQVTGPNTFVAMPQVFPTTAGVRAGVPQGTLTYVWGADAGVVTSLPGGPTVVESTCPILLDRFGQLAGCSDLAGQRFEVTPVLTMRGPTRFNSRPGYQLRVSSARSLALLSPDGGVVITPLPIPSGRPAAPLTLDCHRGPDGGLTALEHASLIVTTDDGSVLSVSTPASGLDAISAWPRHQRSASNIGSESVPALIRGDCP